MSRKTPKVLRKISTPILLIPAVAITLVFLVTGLIFGIIASLTPAGTFSLENYVSVFRDYTLVLRDTLLMAVGITTLLVAISLPIAYYLAVRVQSDALKLVALLVMLVPFWTDWNIRMISWYPVLSGSGLINQIYLWVMRSLGYGNVEPLKILFQNSGVLISWIQSYILFMIVPIYLGLLRMDPKILKAAATLGANRIQVFYHITLKWSVPGIIIGSVFVFCMSMADYATPAIIGGGLPTMGMIIWLTAAWGLNFNLAMAMSVVMLVVIGAVVVSMLKLVDITRVMY